MSRVISDEEIQNIDSKLCQDEVYLNDKGGEFYSTKKFLDAQRDSSDREWIKWLEEHFHQLWDEGAHEGWGWYLLEQEWQALKQKIGEQD